MQHSLGHRKAQPVRHQGRCLGQQVEPVEVVARHPADIEGVGEAFGRHQRGFRKPGFHDVVGHHRGAMHQLGHRVPGQIDRRQGRNQAGDGVARHARHLGGADVSPGPVGRHHVREGAADIDAYTPDRIHRPHPTSHQSARRPDRHGPRISDFRKFLHRKTLNSEISGGQLALCIGSPGHAAIRSARSVIASAERDRAWQTCSAGTRRMRSAKPTIPSAKKTWRPSSFSGQA